MITRPTLSGTAVRITLENTFGMQPVMIGAAYVGQRTNGALLVPGSNMPVTFNGTPSVIIPAQGKVVSDPVPLAVQAMQDIAVSLFVPGSSVPISRHTNARVTSFTTTPARQPRRGCVQLFDDHDLYWDGGRRLLTASGPSSPSARSRGRGDARWPTAAVSWACCCSTPSRRFGIVNEGIGGNRVIRPGGNGPAAVERLDRDVLARSGASTVIFFEGTNDVAGGATADEVIEGSQQIIDRVRAAGLQIIGVTMIPRHNAAWTPQMTEYRNTINDWIRNKADYDAVIDFDAVVRDPANPDLMNPIYDLGDHIHPNPLGYLVMGQSIDLSLFSNHGSH
jgi:lysophospholipase L1-like esterase